ncbi:unnamed protein product [Urochloa humidicola]
MQILWFLWGQGTPPLIGRFHDCSGLQTFAYVETTEPLALYGCDGSKELAYQYAKEGVSHWWHGRSKR